MQFLPKTRTKSLLFVILALCGICLGCIVSALARVEGPGLYFALALFMPLMIGLWLQSNAARVLASAVIMFMVILAPPSIISPWAAMNGDTPDCPDVWELVADVYSWVLVGLLAVHILGKYKDEFVPFLKHK